MPSIRRPRTTAALVAALASAGLLASQVFAAPPTVSGLTVSPNPPVAGEPSTYSVTGADPDDDITGYEWDFDFDGSFTVDDTSTAGSIDHTFSDPGPQSVAVRAVDAPGGDDTTEDRSAPAVRSINVAQANRAPTITSVTITGVAPNNGGVPHVGQRVSFSATATDPDGDNLTYSWDFGDGDDGGGSTVRHPYATAGTKTVTLSVSDGRASPVTTTQDVRINALPTPAINLVYGTTAVPGQRRNIPYVGQGFVFTGNAGVPIDPAPPAPGCPDPPASPAPAGSSDPEGAIGAFAWDLNNDGTFEAAGANAPAPAFPAGMHTVGLRVTDSDLAVATTTLQFRVNAAPTARFLIDPTAPLINTQTTFSSTSTDPDDAALTHSWDLDNDGVFCETGETGQNVARSFATAGTYPVRLMVTDSGGLSRAVTRNVVVQNTVPTASVSHSPAAPIPGQAAMFRASVRSPTGKAIQSMQWDFDFDPSKDQFDVNASGATVARAFSSAGRKTIGLKVQEVGGGYTIVDHTLVVNSPPRAAFTVTPSSLFAGDTAVVASTSGDADGPLVAQDWDFDGDGQYDDARGSVVNARFGKVGTFVVGLRVTDDKGATSVASSKVTVKKRPLKLLTGVLIQIRGSVDGRFTKLKRLLVKAPRGAKVNVKCMKRGCHAKASKRGNGRKQRVRAVEGRMAAGTKIVITVSKRGYLTQKTTYTTRLRKGPVRKDVCLEPGSKKGTGCPAGS
jgi:PKD repeat protein